MKTKQQKAQKMCVIDQLNNRIKYLEENKINIDRLKKYYQKFKRNNESLLKAQQRLKSKSHNVFSEEINKIALSSNDGKRMQSFDSIETYTYEMTKDLVNEKEEIKRNNITKQNKK